MYLHIIKSFSVPLLSYCITLINRNKNKELSGFTDKYAVVISLISAT